MILIKNSSYYFFLLKGTIFIKTILLLGTTILISGIIAGTKDAQFAIDLYNNASMKIIMRFNPRFETKMVVRNSHRDDFK